MAPRLALNEVALELSGTWVLIKSVKTTSDCIVDFLAKKFFKKICLLKKNHHGIRLGEDTSAVTTGKQISVKPESSRRHWYLAAIFSNHILRFLCQSLQIFQMPTEEAGMIL